MAKYKFGKRSRKRLEGVHPDLVKVAEECLNLMDIAIIEGVRSLDKQKDYLRTGATKTLKSKHLIGHALDLTPYPVDMTSDMGIKRHYYMAGMLRGIAHMMDIKIRSGADWDNDGQITDQTFMDLVHIEKIK
jgi:peptidoglycan L-alanyl-D-glutamate endopeptidase CwlK